MDSNLKIDYIKSVVAKETNYKGKKMQIVHEKTNRVFFELGKENEVVKTVLDKENLLSTYNISVSLELNKLTIKRTKDVKRDLNPDIIFLTKNLKNKVLSKIDEIDLLDENDKNIEKEKKMDSNLKIDYIKSVVAKETNYKGKKMQIVHEKTNRVFFELGKENEVVKTVLDKENLLSTYNISVSLELNKLTIKRTKDVKRDLNPDIIFLTKNLKNKVLSKIDEIDLLDENDKNIEVEVSLNEDEVILLPFNTKSNERILIDLVQ